MRISTLLLSCLFLIGTTGTPATAQQNDQRSPNDHGQNDRDDRPRWDTGEDWDDNSSNNGNRNQQRDRSGQQDSQSREYRVQPGGWVGVAYDYDNDGYYDAADYLYYYDIQAARDRSGQRARDSERRRQQGRDRQQVSIRGELTNLGIKSLTAGMDDRDYRFAEVRTDSDRTARVCLGTEEKVSQLDLREGDRVQVEGVRAQIDDKTVLLARRVSSNGDSIENKLPRRENWQRIEGEVRDVRTAGGDDRDQRHQVIEVRTEEGPRQVDLGPASEVEQLDLQQGDRVKLLARRGKIGGQAMLIGQKVRANGTTVDVREATDRSLRKAQSSQSDNSRR